MIGAYKYAFASKGPVVIIASKEVLPNLENTDINKVSKGGYLLKSGEDDEVCIIASGSEVDIALKVSEALDKHMISSRVVSMPSLELFLKQKQEEKEKLLPRDMKKVVIELSSCQSYYKLLDHDDLVFNVTDYAKSGSKDELIEKLKFDPSSITEEILASIKQRK